MENKISEYQKILAARPHSTIFAALSEAYRKDGNLEEAARVCQDGLRIHPNYSTAHLVMAKIYLDLEKLDDAAEEIRLASKNGAQPCTTHILEGRIHLKKGKFKEALVTLQKAHMLQPANEGVTRWLRVAKKMAWERKLRTELRGKITWPSNANRKGSPQELLHDLIHIPGVQGAVVVDKEGQVYDGFESEQISQVALADVGTAIYRSGSSGLKKMGLGQLTEVFVETVSTRLWVVEAGGGLLALLAGEELPPGLIMFKIGETLKGLSEFEKGGNR